MSRRRALLSVWDKTGIAAFGKELADRGWEVLSTGGTARALAAAGIPVTEVSTTTGHPEMMDGRVKTLHPAIHAGLLARRDRPGDMAELAGQGYAPIDLVAVNLYPFRETVASPDVTLGVAMENVDIGGPTMIRAAAKNHRDVWVVVDPADYGAALEALGGARGHGREDAGPGTLRRKLAAKVFREISSYDGAVAEYLEGAATAAGAGESMAEQVRLELTRRSVPRYGENPGQEAGFYSRRGAQGGMAELEQMHGKELSYNNILDLDGALLSLAPFAFATDPAVCIVKHTTPCGLAVRPNPCRRLRAGPCHRSGLGLRFGDRGQPSRRPGDGCRNRRDVRGMRRGARTSPPRRWMCSLRRRTSAFFGFRGRPWPIPVSPFRTSVGWNWMTRCAPRRGFWRGPRGMEARPGTRACREKRVP